MAAIKLPGRMEPSGLEARVLLAESSTPARKDYTGADAKLCMELMDRVLWNRVANPKTFGAKKNSNLLGVIKAKGQFAGFESYPDYAASIVTRIQSLLDIANGKNDLRAPTYAAHVQLSLDLAANPLPTPDPSPGALVSWRTEGHGGPGSNFKMFKTILGITFYYIVV